MGTNFSPRRPKWITREATNRKTGFLKPCTAKQLTDFIELRAKSNEGGRLTGADIHTYIMKEFGKNYHPDSIYYLLKHLGFSWISSRSRHPKQSDKIQEDFKKIQN